MDNIKFLVCGDVNPPKRNAGSDAGFDFFVPNYSDDFCKQLEETNTHFKVIGTGVLTNPKTYKPGIFVDPGYDIKIPSLIRAYIPSDQCLLLVNKSGVALKQKLAVGACLVDSSYEGIIHLHMFNIGKDRVFIEFGQKLVQAVPYLINNQEHEVFYEKDISKEEFYKDHSHERGDGGFGSTGLN